MRILFLFFIFSSFLSAESFIDYQNRLINEDIEWEKVQELNILGWKRIQKSYRAKISKDSIKANKSQLFKTFSIEKSKKVIGRVDINFQKASITMQLIVKAQDSSSGAILIINEFKKRYVSAIRQVDSTLFSLLIDDKIKQIVDIAVKNINLRIKQDKTLLMIKTELEIPFGGENGLLSLFSLGSNQKSSIFRKRKHQRKKSTYSSIVIDARDFDLEPSFRPIIKDIEGRIVFSTDKIDKIYALNQTSIWANALEIAEEHKLYGTKPFFIMTATKAEKNVLFIEVELANKILKECRKSDIIEKAKVFFITK